MWVCIPVVAVLLMAVSGMPGMCVPRRWAIMHWLAAAMLVGGAALGLVAALAMLVIGGGVAFQVRGPLPGLAFSFHLDPLGAFFLAPVCLVGAMGAVYGLSYWTPRRRPRTTQRLRLWYGLLIGSMAMVVLASNAIAFLFAWEIMALSAFFLVATEEHKQESREAGWLYLVSTHASTLLLFALFTLLRVASGSFDFRPLAAHQAGIGLRTAVFLLALFGFGIKAGMMPLHFWLPSAHAAAPSHVSAILSAVLLKIGIYGLLRTLMFLGAPPIAWGGLVLLLGTASAVLGVLFALGQHDLKRLLAYHSIENIGIILMGLGVALIGAARGNALCAALGLAGCLLHVWNHALFKSLLFLAAGSVVHAARTRQIDRMGGLAKPMPRTFLWFFLGAFAICGLPPLNGFISELLVYLGLFRSLNGAAGAALAAPALALVGALAVACFVKAVGAVFLGRPRGRRLERTHETPWLMRLPMSVLAACCVAIGVVPMLVVRPLESTVRQWSGQAPASLAPAIAGPLATLTPVTASLGGSLLLALLVGGLRMGRRLTRSGVTWDCGYARPTARMQYTASSFADTLVQLFRGILRPRQHQTGIYDAFPRKAKFESHVDDVVLNRLVLPLWRGLRVHLGRLRVLQQGSIQRYLLYILLIVSVLLLVSAPLGVTFRELFGAHAPAKGMIQSQ